MRYEYATPQWEADNRLTNYDPVSNSMKAAKDGSIADRALVNPDRNNFGPRLGLAYSADANHGDPKRVGHELCSRQPDRVGQPAGHQRPAGRALGVEPDVSTAAFRPTEQGYPSGITDPAAFNPGTALVSYIDPDYKSSPVQNWYVSVQQPVGRAPDD